MEEETNAKATELEGNSSTETRGQSSFSKSVDDTIEPPGPGIKLDREEPKEKWFDAYSRQKAAAAEKLAVEPAQSAESPDAADRRRETEDILARSSSRWNAEDWAFLPSAQESYGTTPDLFNRIKLLIAEQTGLSDDASALLTFWAFSTWFQEVLSLAPSLIITGRGYEGEIILRALRAFCSLPVLIAGMTSADLKFLNWRAHPTLLLSEPNLGKRLAPFLNCSTRHGFVTHTKEYNIDYFGSRAVYLSEDAAASSLTYSVRINASETRRAELRLAQPISDERAQQFQNQLYWYRALNLRTVSKSDFNASGLPPEANAIANALGSCIVDAPELQAELVSLLMPQARQQIADHFDDLGALAVGAALSLCHKGKEKVLVGEIATEVNRVLLERGERLKYSPETVGHSLKKAGLLSRRLSGAGNGYVFDHATEVRLHEIAAGYGCVGLTDDKMTLKCPLCKQNKQVMDVV